MTTYVWGTNSDFWGVRTEWTPKGFPDAATDAGDITAAGTYTVTVDPSTIFLLDALVLDDANAELDVQGTLDFAGVDNTLALNAGTLLADSGGIIQGATIQSDGGALASNGGTLDAVTDLGELDISGSLTTEGGLTVDTAADVPGGTIVVIGDRASLSVMGGLTVGASGTPGTIMLEGYGSGLGFGDSETLDNAIVTVSGNGDVIETYDATLTFGADTAVTLSGSGDTLSDSFINDGAIAVTGGYSVTNDDYVSSTFDNKGSLSVANSSLDIDNNTFNNERSIDVGSSGQLSIDNYTFTNEGSIDVGNGGVLSIYNVTTFTNTGSMTVASGGTLSLDGSYTLAQIDNGITVESGGLLEIFGGELDLGGGTMDVAATGPFSNVSLIGGTIEDGTIVADGGASAYEGVFSDVTYKGELDPNTFLSIINGLTVESATGTLPGSIVINDNVFLSFDDAETLDNVAVSVSGNFASIQAYLQTSTFGVDTTVTLSGIGENLYGSFVNAGDIAITGGDTTTQDEYNAGTLDNQGSLTVDGGSLTIENSTFTNEGTFSISNGASVDVEAANFSSTDAILVGGAAALVIDTTTAAGIAYDDPATVILTDPTTYSGTLYDFTLGDMLQLNGEDVASASIVGTTLTAVLYGGGTLDYNTGPGLNGTNFNISMGDDGYQDLLTVVCFLAGTRILTELGGVAVEDLREGDRVVTRGPDDATMAPVRWIGHRRIDCRGHPNPNRVRPIRIAAGAFADAVPARDLWLSPDHAVYVDGVLIPVQYLLDGVSVVQERRDTITYYHVELERHSVILAEGLETESYLDTDGRTRFDNADGAVRLGPVPLPDQDTVTRVWDGRGCAPLVVTGPVVAAVRERLRRRSGVLIAA